MGTSGENDRSGGWVLSVTKQDRLATTAQALRCYRYRYCKVSRYVRRYRTCPASHLTSHYSPTKYTSPTQSNERSRPHWVISPHDTVNMTADTHSQSEKADVKGQEGQRETSKNNDETTTEEDEELHARFSPEEEAVCSVFMFPFACSRTQKGASTRSRAAHLDESVIVEVRRVLSKTPFRGLRCSVEWLMSPYRAHHLTLSVFLAGSITHSNTHSLAHSHSLLRAASHSHGKRHTYRDLTNTCPEPRRRVQRQQDRGQRPVRLVQV